jgi:hypothetical protein
LFFSFHVQGKLVSGLYTSGEEFAYDVNLVFSNCYKYNGPQDQIVAWAKHLETLFLQHWRKIHAREVSIREKEEMDEMKQVIDALRVEHQKLVQELDKLVKARAKTSPPTTPAATTPAAAPGTATTVPPGVPSPAAAPAPEPATTTTTPAAAPTAALPSSPSKLAM